ncbi:MAG: class I SAM-dependent methyltransferase [Armatimonadetes bacterium]|nr:class I SAM-dependent methyltransferase [Armatimonadota bacterium]
MKCIACSSDKVQKVWVDKWGDSFEKQIYRCDVCGLGFVHPMPSKDILKSLYDTSNYFVGCDNSLGYVCYEPPYGWFCELLLQMKQYGASSPLLDVGSATGVFLLLAQQKGLYGFGIEPSSWAAEQAKAKGVETLVGLFEEVASTLPSQSFGAIAMSHVVEHFAKPVLVLEECFRLLCQGGVLGILTPNYASPKWQNPEKAYSQSREHLFYFTPKSLQLMVAQTGFKILKLTTLPCPSPSAWSLSESFLGHPVHFSRLMSKWVTWIYKGIFRRTLKPYQWSDMILVAVKV